MPEQSHAQGNLLLIGYGNELRGDDAAGLHVGRSVEALHLPGVDVHICHQLTPELACLLSKAPVVVFADAAVSGRPGTVELSPLSSQPESAQFHHALSPGALAQLCEAAMGHRPEAFMLRVYISQCELGAGLSPEAQQGVKQAVDLFKEFWGVFANQRARIWKSVRLLLR